MTTQPEPGQRGTGLQWGSRPETPVTTADRFLRTIDAKRAQLSARRTIVR